MASGDVSTLHYYVKSLGGEQREPNFLRTFRISNPDLNQFDRDLVKNLLELEMCVALRTLPQKELVQWLPHGETEVKFPSVHLNVANPLIQGAFPSASLRQISRSLLLNSADPEVRQWPNTRSKQLASEPRQTVGIVPYVPLAAYATIFNDAVQANADKLGELKPFDSDLRVPFDENFLQGTHLENCQEAISEYLDYPVPLVRPSGSLDSPIAIILSGVEGFRSSTLSQQDDSVPYGIREMGLNARNSLIWPFNLRQSGISRPEEMSTVVATTEAAHFRNYSLSLIAASSARFVLVCGEMGQRYLFDEAEELSSPIKITLRGYDVVLRFQLDGTHIQRAFVVTPDPQKMTLRGDWRIVQKFAQIVRLAAILTKTESINYNFFENNQACASIFRAVAEEKTSGIPLTIDLIEPGVRQWLARKGFQTDEDIEELTGLVGSLGDGLFVLLCSLPKRPNGTVGRVSSGEKRVVKGPKCSKELLTAVRNLRQEKIRKNYPDLAEDDHDKLPDVARINISQKRSDQDTSGDGGLHKSDDVSEDDFEQPNGEPVSMMEISLNITDEPKLEIAEVHDTVDSQRLSKGKSVIGQVGGQAFRAKLVRKLYEGSLYDLRTHTQHERQTRHYFVVLGICIRVPSCIDLDTGRQATVTAELADKGSKQDDTKRLAMNKSATAAAQRLAISVSVFTKNGESIKFWAENRGEQDAQRAHRLVEDLDALYAEEATESLE